MRLDRITLENVQQYEGRQSLEFAAPGPRNVTLIKGLNGAGKTNLLEALRWCLYGLPPGESPKDLVSKGRLAQATPGQEFATSAELFFDHEGRSYSARRALRVHVGAHLPDGRASFSTIEDGFNLCELPPAGDAIEISGPIEQMRSILPRDAADYFFFDGEKIDTFARPDNARGITEAVRHVLKFLDLERAITHLDDVRSDYDKQLKSLARGTAVESLLTQQEQFEAEVRAHRARLAEVDSELHDVREFKAQIDTALLEMRAATALILERQRLESELAAWNLRAAQAIELIATTLPQAPVALTRGALDKTASEAESKRKRGEIPSRVRDVVARDLLAAGRCICGRELAHGTVPYETIEGLQHGALPSGLEEKVIAAAGMYPAMARRSAATIDGLRGALADHHTATAEATTTQAKLNDVKNQLADVRQEDVQELVERGRKLDRQLQDLVAEQARLRTLAERLERQIEQADGEIKRQQNLSTTAERVRLRATLAREAERALRETRERFSAQVRAEIERGTSEMFQKLLWKPSSFDKVEISEAFGLSVLDRWGAPALGELSAGETEVLSLAFIVTMGRVAAETVDSRAPVVIDSPFGRLGAEPRDNIAQILPSMVDQLVLLVTDTELVATEGALLPHIGKRYELRFDIETSATTIAEVSPNG